MDLAQLVVVSAWLFTRGGAADVAIFGIVRTLVPAVGVPAVTALGFRIGPGTLLRILARLAATGSVVMALAVASGGPTSVVMVCAGIVGLALGCFRPVTCALLPEVVGSPAELVSANATNGFAEGASSLVGPVIGSLIAAVLGVPPLLMITGAGMLWVGAVAGRLPATPTGRQAAAGRSRFADYVAGGRELMANRPARLVTLLGTAQTFVRGAMSVIVVAFAIDVLRSGDAGVGLLYGAIGVGGLVGLPVAVLVVDRTGVHRSLVPGLTMWGLPLALAALAPAPIVALAMFAVIGLGNSVMDISYDAVLQRSVDERVLTRVFGLVEAMLQAGLAAGAFCGAVLLDSTGARPALLAIGLLLPVLAVLSSRRLGALDRILGRRDDEIGRMREQADLAHLPIAALDRLATGVAA